MCFPVHLDSIPFPGSDYWLSIRDPLSSHPDPLHPCSSYLSALSFPMGLYFTASRPHLFSFEFLLCFCVIALPPPYKGSVIFISLEDKIKLSDQQCL